MHRRTRKRYEIEGHARYLTFSCYRRLPLFDDDSIKRIFAERLMLDREHFGFALIAWVIMPEHVHALLLPEPPEVTVTAILRSIKRRSANAALAELRSKRLDLIPSLSDSSGATHFWQKGGGYDRNIYTREELIEKAGYIHANPVRRGLVTDPTEWPWSSCRAWAGLSTEWPQVERV